MNNIDLSNGQHHTYTILQHASVGLACYFLCVFPSAVAEGANVESL